MTSGVVNIRGKDYQTVPYRVQRFWEEYAGCSIETELLHADDEVVRMKAVIREIESGRIKAVGHAEEYRSASKINQTSALENCETSAVGRALANLGLAGDSSIASAEEVMGAVIQQETKEFLDRMEVIRDRWDTIDFVKSELAGDNIDAAKEALGELSDEEKHKLWKAPSKGGVFTTREVAQIKGVKKV